MPDSAPQNLLKVAIVLLFAMTGMIFAEEKTPDKTPSEKTVPEKTTAIKTLPPPEQTPEEIINIVKKFKELAIIADEKLQVAKGEKYPAKKLAEASKAVMEFDQALRLLESLPKDHTFRNDDFVVLFMKLMQEAEAICPRDFTNSIGMKFKLISAGEFMMGSPDDEKKREKDEGPQHEVTLSQPFYLGVYEVTQEQYEKVMGKNPSEFKGKNKPVEQVSWDDAQEFCKKLNELEKKEGREYRLPTEAEWEYACRAGSKTRYYWGDEMDKDYCWCLGNSDHQTHDVGGKRPNAFGLYDMNGNVWEWCSDWYADKYEAEGQWNPKGSATGIYRVLRGGSCSTYSGYCRSAFRVGSAPDGQLCGDGFRVVWALQK